MPRNPNNPKTPTELKSLARSYTAMGIRVLAGIARSPKCHESARIAAVKELKEWGWGKAAQAVEMTVDDKRDTSQALETVRELMFGQPTAPAEPAPDQPEPTKH